MAVAEQFFYKVTTRLGVLTTAKLTTKLSVHMHYLLDGGVVNVAPTATLRLEAPLLVGVDMVDTALVGVWRVVRWPLGVNVSILGMAQSEHPFRDEAFLLLTAEEGRGPA